MGCLATCAAPRLPTARSLPPACSPQMADLAAQLLAAVEAGDAAAVNAALDAGANPNKLVGAPGELWPFNAALDLACKRGHLACLQALLTAGADPCYLAHIIEYRTPIYHAYSGGHTQCVAALLAAGETRDAQLRAAVATSNVAGVEEALAGGADPNLLVDNITAGGKPHSTPDYNSIATYRQDTSHPTLILHVACQFSIEDCVRALLAAGADPEAADDNCMSYALDRARWCGRPDIERVLLAAAPGLEALVAPPSGRRPAGELSKAVRRLEWTAVHSLLESHPLPTAEEALTALQWVQDYGSERWHSGIHASVFAPLVVHRPLTPAQWKRVPHPCPELGTVLPAVLVRSAAEAALVVRRLLPYQRRRLQTAALCLARAQRTHGTPLPAAFVGQVLALVLDEPYEIRDWGPPWDSSSSSGSDSDGNSSSGSDSDGEGGAG